MKRRERRSLDGIRWLGGQRLMTVAELERRQVTLAPVRTYPSSPCDLEVQRTPAPTLPGPIAMAPILPSLFYSRVQSEQTFQSTTRGESAAGMHTHAIRDHLYTPKRIILPLFSFIHPLSVPQVVQQI